MHNRAKNSDTQRMIYKNRTKYALETGCHDWYDAKKKKMIIFDHEALFDLHRTELAANWK